MVTGHWAQNRLAFRWRWRRLSPRSPSGWKNIEGSVPRHRADICQPQDSAFRTIGGAAEVNPQRWRVPTLCMVGLVVESTGCSHQFELLPVCVHLCLGDRRRRAGEQPVDADDVMGLGDQVQERGPDDAPAAPDPGGPSRQLPRRTATHSPRLPSVKVVRPRSACRHRSPRSRRPLPAPRDGTRRPNAPAKRCCTRVTPLHRCNGATCVTPRPARWRPGGGGR
jgi:hypothetical protein